DAAQATTSAANAAQAAIAGPRSVRIARESLAGRRAAILPAFAARRRLDGRAGRTHRQPPFSGYGLSCAPRRRRLLRDPAARAGTDAGRAGAGRPADERGRR